MKILRDRARATIAEHGNPPVPPELMAEAYWLYHHVFHRMVDFRRTPEDMHSPLMADLRPMLPTVEPEAVDAALAVQRYLLLQGGDAIRYLSSIMNRAAVLIDLARDERFDEFYLSPPGVANETLIFMVAARSLSETLNSDFILSLARDIAILRADSLANSAAFNQTLAGIEAIDPPTTTRH